MVEYTYPCKRNWDCEHFFACLAASVGCGTVCGVAICDPVPADEVACFACLGAFGAGCLDPCSYVEACEKDTSNDDLIGKKKKPVFSYFNGTGCSG